MTDAAPQPALDRLTARLTQLIRVATNALEADPSRVGDWQAELTRQLRRYHLAAFIAGNDGAAPSALAQQAIDADLAVQARFLGRFALEIQDAATWERGWNARAKSYALSIKAPYWRGKVKMLPLPAMPTQGTQCMGNCGCQWEVITINEDTSDYDAFWRRNKNDSCQTCLQREAEWSPVSIRNGELQ